MNTIKLVACLILYPIWALTGTLPTTRIGPRPGPTYIYSLVIYVVFGLLHWWPLIGGVNAVGSIVVNFILVRVLLTARFGTMCLMAWAASDIIYLVSGFHSKEWDWLLLGVYFGRTLKLINERKSKS